MLYARGPLWVKLGRKLDVRAESAFPKIADIVGYGRDLRHVRSEYRGGRHSSTRVGGIG